MNRGQVISNDGVKLNYVVQGTGPKILVIGSSVYYPQLFSAELFAQFQFIFLDHRGFASPSAALKPEQYRLDRVLDDLELARQQLGLSDVVIMGHSGHAFMALEYARKYPEQVHKVILLNSAPSNSRERQSQSTAFFNETASLERKTGFEQDMALLEGDIRLDPERRFVHMCIRMGAQSFYDYSFDAAYMWEQVQTNMPVMDYLWGEVFAGMNLLQMLKDVSMPVFIGLGRYDYLVGPVSLWEAIDETYPHVKKVIFEHSGHNPMFEQPELFNQILIEWMTQE
ncbi:alpha/beta hydrolase [Paenibacillus sp. FSL H7-0357]|uniref:alpha/beta fold hydrolase n=1 Tax=Paenibacillus sp. FSL H7-0357 TaxID=1536774 RepID=UPI0004F7CF2B|nr:alpha/beta hydrolase [Paenibacillus sp. FSL H7-0357]AIQ17983.1 alpha/beta hydrolase [Paenibacillus sp. FSL H7-0357]